MICYDCQTALPELLLDPAAPSNAAAREHLKSCPACNQEFQSLEATFDLLDTWQAPEPSLYFDQKLAVRLREEQALPAAGWFERMRSRLLFNTGRQFRPAVAGALAVAFLVAGGTFADLSGFPHPAKTQISATVNDLQILDKNDQALQTMSLLLQDDGSSNDNLALPPSS
jgi:predicted anti-sigma-YlaC factor YlaD